MTEPIEPITSSKEILSIAQQCPYTGGPAVERARTLIAMVNDSVFYDDVNTCLQVGVYKQTPDDSLKQVNGNALILIPNPAKETFQVGLIGGLSD